MKLNFEEVVCHVLLQSFSHKVKWVCQVPGHVVHSLRFAFELELFCLAGSPTGVPLILHRL